MSLLDDTKRWFEATLTMLSVKPDTTKAIQYLLNRWPSPIYYCNDGCAESNLLLNMRGAGVALGRRNYLFVRSTTEPSAPLRSTRSSEQRA
ncbi:hypothetical protein DF146_19510 [Burkholderia cenocepacia]|nr:hypothetical protein DF165_14280 [Burkholderia cenocepacia]RQU51396.1 hypothetical protein DF146_19510 [Burkholderia cenocepacia]